MELRFPRLRRLRRHHAPRRVLVLGGTRSGKSAEAERRLHREPAVTYVATGGTGPGDREWAERIAAHRSRRPTSWRTLETTDLEGALRSAQGAVLVDSLTLWLAAALEECGAYGDDEPPGARARVHDRVDRLVEAWAATSATAVIVSDEVGSGVVPPTASGRLFRDELGRLNARIAATADEVVLVVAGQALVLKGRRP